MDSTYPQTAQGPASVATPDEIAKENPPSYNGYTNPNLHRRAANESGLPRTEYGFIVSGVNSYRVARVITHDDEDPNASGEVP